MKRSHSTLLPCFGVIGAAGPLSVFAAAFVAAAVLFFSSALAFGQGAAVDTKTEPKTPDPCASGHEFTTADCALTWHGITLYGAYDAGVGWASPNPASTAHTVSTVDHIRLSIRSIM